MPQEILPHELFAAAARDAVGGRAKLFGDLTEDLFEKIVIGVTDQLSGYLQVMPHARFRLGAVNLREGSVRSYVLAQLTDRRSPLRLHEAMLRWEDDPAGGSEDDFVEAVNGRRWYFANRYLNRLMVPMMLRIADAVASYYERRPGAKLNVDLIRLCEDVDKTYLVIELDDRSGPAASKDRGRTGYMVQ